MTSRMIQPSTQAETRTGCSTREIVYGYAGLIIAVVLHCLMILLRSNWSTSGDISCGGFCILGIFSIRVDRRGFNSTYWLSKQSTHWSSWPRYLLYTCNSQHWSLKFYFISSVAMSIGFTTTFISLVGASIGSTTTLIFASCERIFRIFGIYSPSTLRVIFSNRGRSLRSADWAVLYGDVLRKSYTTSVGWG